MKHVNVKFYKAHPDGVIWKKLTIDDKYINKLVTFYTSNHISKRCWEEKNFNSTWKYRIFQHEYQGQVKMHIYFYLTYNKFPLQFVFIYSIYLT